MDRRNFLTGSAVAAVAVAVPLPAFAQAAESLWQIGPVIRGRNYSVGMPAHPTRSREGWYFDFPGPTARDGHAHYLTRPVSSMRRARGIRLRYRIDARPGTRFVPQQHHDLPGTLSLYFQRAGDDWASRRGTENYRWYAPHDRVVDLAPGDHELLIRFDEPWISVNGQPSHDHAAAFADALDDASVAGFVLGSRQARGHGVYTTAPARMTVLGFDIVG